MLKFGLFADIHYARGFVLNNRYCMDSIGKMKMCIDFFNRQELDFVVSLGDIVNHSSGRNSCDNLRRIQKQISLCRHKTHYVIGNHDIENRTKDGFLKSCRNGAHTSCYSFGHKGILFIILDGNYKESGEDYACTVQDADYHWEDSYINEAQLGWLKNELMIFREMKKIVFIHQNVDERIINGGSDPHILKNAARLRGILNEDGNVLSVMQGHYHDGFFQVMDRIPYITLRAMCEGKGVKNNAFAVVTVKDNYDIALDGYGKQHSYRVKYKNPCEDVVIFE